MFISLHVSMESMQYQSKSHFSMETDMSILKFMWTCRAKKNQYNLEEEQSCLHTWYQD